MRPAVALGLAAACAVAEAGSPPPTPLTSLHLSIGSPAPPCPAGTDRIAEGGGWDGDFNDDAGGDYVYLCAGSGGGQPPITDLQAVTTLAARPSGACPEGWEQLEGNMNSGSHKDLGFMYLCASRKPGSAPIDVLTGELKKNGCASTSSVVLGAKTVRNPPLPRLALSPLLRIRRWAGQGSAFDFDPGGAGVVLCMDHTKGPVTTLALAIGSHTNASCPHGTERIDARSPWDGDCKCSRSLCVFFRSLKEARLHSQRGGGWLVRLPVCRQRRRPASDHEPPRRLQPYRQGERCLPHGLRAGCRQHECRLVEERLHLPLRQQGHERQHWRHRGAHGRARCDGMRQWSRGSARSGLQWSVC